MLDNEEKIEEVVAAESTDLLAATDPLDIALLSVPLERSEQKIVSDIVEAPTKEILQQQFELFNINQSKKNALRIIKLNSLLDKVEDQVIERFEKRPDQISNKELIEYMGVVSGQIDRAQKFSTDTLDPDKPGIKITNQKNEVNITVAQTLDRDDKEKVMDAVNALLKQIKNNDTSITPAEPIEVEAKLIDEEFTENTENTLNESVYLEEKSEDFNKLNTEEE